MTSLPEKSESLLRSVGDEFRATQKFHATQEELENREPIALLLSLGMIEQKMLALVDGPRTGPIFGYRITEKGRAYLREKGNE